MDYELNNFNNLFDENRLKELFTTILSYIKYARFAITAFVITWIVVISYKMMKADDVKPFNESNTGYSVYAGYTPYAKPFASKQDTKDEDGNSTIMNKRSEGPSSIQYFNLHRILFGDESPLMLLFKLWYLAAFFILLRIVISRLGIKFE